MEPLRTVRDHLSELGGRVEHHHERVVMTRNGLPAAVLMSPDDLSAVGRDDWRLSDAEALAGIGEADAA
jgi:antitoxin YefM